MPKYTCERCLKDFKQKSHYNKHLARKTPCQDNNDKIKEIVNEVVEEKLKKVEKKLTIVETFVGAGGAHIGFKNAGFKSVLVNDNEKYTIDTLLMNNVITEDQYLLCPIEDITKDLLNSKIKDTDIDVFFGGIVCKGFSLAGVRNPFDIRNYLYKHQLRLVGYMMPKVSVIENVTAIKNMFLYTECKETKEVFKKYTDLSDINKILNGKKSSNRKNGSEDLNINVKINNNKREMKLLLSNIEKFKYNVLDDIKKLYKDLGYTVYEKILQTDKYGGFTSRKRIIIVAVRNDIKNKYEFPKELDIKYTLNDALKLIDYNNVNNPKNDSDNIPMKHNEKTIERFKYIPEGKNIKDILNNLPEKLKVSAFYSRGSTQRLDRNKPTPTLVPGHSNFPIHPWEHRSITVREAATITGFPTNYKFTGSHSSRCIQIGNAVPTHLSYHIGLSIKRLLS